MMARHTYVIIRIDIKDDADVDDIVNEMDYTLTHKDIIDTEVVGSSDDWLNTLPPKEKDLLILTRGGDSNGKCIE